MRGNTPGAVSSATDTSGRNGLTLLSTPDPGSTTPGAGEATESASEPIDVLSGSSLNTFLRCARQWEYAYVYGLKRPPNLKMVSGTAAHEAVEIDLRQKMDSSVDLPQDDVLDAYATAYARESEDAFEEPDKGLTKGSVKDTGIRQLKLWHGQVAPGIHPMLVEEPISFSINGVPWTGTLDVADLDLVVHDWKFTHKTPSSGEAYLLSMVGYAIGFRVSTGLIESRVIIDNIVGLKTKTTHVKFASDGPVPDRSLRAFAGAVSDANRSIQAGIFPPTGIKSGACSWCGYRDICPAYKDSPMKGAERDTDE